MLFSQNVKNVVQTLDVAVSYKTVFVQVVLPLKANSHVNTKTYRMH